MTEPNDEQQTPPATPEVAEQPPAESESAETQAAAPPPEPEVVLDPLELQQRVEAILLTVDRPMPLAKIAEALGLSSGKPVTEAIDTLNDHYARTQRAFRIEQLAGGFQILTLPKFHDTLAQLHKTKSDNRLSPAQMETLAIVAYKQPILRAQIEAIRGVACGEVLRALMDKHLVKIVGRAEELGRPMLYGTTKTFLEVFGLASLKDLPKAEDMPKP